MSKEDSRVLIAKRQDSLAFGRAGEDGVGLLDTLQQYLSVDRPGANGNALVVSSVEWEAETALQPCARIVAWPCAYAKGWHSHSAA